MDDSRRHSEATTNLHVSKKVGEFTDFASTYSVDTELRLYSSGVSKLLTFDMKSKGRSTLIDDGPMNGQANYSLTITGLDSMTSCGTVLSKKNIGYTHPTDLDLGFHLQLGSKKILDAEKSLFPSPKTLEPKRPVLDLELSLSTRPSDSDITDVTQNSTASPNSLTVPSSLTQVVDEIATSAPSKLKHVAPLTGVSSNPLVSPNVSSYMSEKTTSQQPQHSSNTRACQVIGCEKGARGASGRCISHGGGSRCQRESCQKGAEGRTAFCKAHGGGRRCQHLGCTKSAEGRTDHCIAHGGGRRCNNEKCSRAARGKSGLCIRHGGGKRCQNENCDKSAEGLSGLCISHGGGRRCQQLGCTKGAQGSTLFCKAHGGGKRCSAPDCTKGAEGSTPFCKGHGGGKRCSHVDDGESCPRSVHGGTSYCVRHGGGKRCIFTGCTKSARGRTDHCVRHGGGKRCKYEACEKSAQGSTDFCKAHGGGNRCSWGEPGSKLGGESVFPCDKFARGKSGFCVVHNLEAEKHTFNTLNGKKDTAMPENSDARISRKRKPERNVDGHGGIPNTGFAHLQIPMHILAQEDTNVPAPFSLPEGRVHGGSLMAMLTKNFGTRSNDPDQIGGEHQETEKFDQILPHSWV